MGPGGSWQPIRTGLRRGGSSSDRASSILQHSKTAKPTAARRTGLVALQVVQPKQELHAVLQQSVCGGQKVRVSSVRVGAATRR